MFYIENSSRLQFVAQVRSAKVADDIQQAASDAEVSGQMLLLLPECSCAGGRGQMVLCWVLQAESL